VTAKSTTVLFVRHGETDWNRNGRLQGWAPTQLNDRGQEQASRLGERLASEHDIDRLVASDLSRTQETAAKIVEAGVDVEPEFDRAWRERGIGVYQGFTWEKLRERFPAFAIQSGAIALDETPEGGESLVDVYERITGAWERLCATAAGETVLVVTHGGPITVMLAHLKTQDLLTAVTEHSIPNCGLTVVDAETSQIQRENEQPFERVEF